MTSVPALDFDHPNVGVIAHFAREPGFDIRRFYPFRSMNAEPSAIAVHGLIDRSRPKKRPMTVQPIHDHIDGAGLGGAAPAQHGVHALRGDSPEVGGDPDVSAKSQCRQRAAELLAATVSNFTRWGVISVEIGRPCDFSNSRIAAAVSDVDDPGFTA